MFERVENENMRCFLLLFRKVTELAIGMVAASFFFFWGMERRWKKEKDIADSPTRISIGFGFGMRGLP